MIQLIGFAKPTTKAIMFWKKKQTMEPAQTEKNNLDSITSTIVL